MNRVRCAALIRDRLIYVKIAVVMLWLYAIGMMAQSGFRRDIEGKPIGTDHIAFFTAAKFIDEGRGTLIYDHQAVGDYQTELNNRLKSPEERQQNSGWILDAYRNPPFYAIPYIPTSRLPYLASFWIWSIIGLLLFWFGIRWLGSEKPGSAFLLAASFYPIFSVFSFGQNSLLSFGFFCLTFYLLMRRYFFLAGMAAGLLLFKPQLLMGLGLWWLLSLPRYWKCLAGLSTMGALLAAVSLTVVPEETRIFIQKMPEIARYNAFMFWNLHNPRAFGTLIAGDDKEVGNVVGLIFMVIAIGCFIWFWRKHRDDMPIMFAASVFLTLWASPHTMIYEWTLAVIPAILLWEYAKDGRDSWILIFSISWVTLFISTPIAQAMFESTWNDQRRTAYAIQISVPIMAIMAVWAARVLNTLAMRK